MGKNSRWYAGAGIFRHVRLTVTPAVHVALWGLSVAPINDLIDINKTAIVSVTVQVQNHDDAEASVSVIGTLNDASGTTVCQIKSGSAFPVQRGSVVSWTQNCSLTGVTLWSTSDPYLYSASVRTTSKEMEDSVQSTFGIRHTSFSPKAGFVLNGVSMKLQGGCVHHDNGALGSRAIDRAEERRVEILKANGYNAIRTSHNPVSQAFVAACDKLGMLLMEEAFDCWDSGKNSDDYHLYFWNNWRRDVSSMVLRDRNSPSIIMWSIGNEIPDRTTSTGYALSRNLSDFIRALDPQTGFNRAITSAFPGVSDAADPYFAPLDVAGYNYSPQRFQGDHARIPSRVMVTTESFPWQSFKYWDAVWTNSYVIGDFIWTAIDYIGESAIGGNGYNAPGDLQACGGYCPQGWSWHISFCGDIDIAGLKKPQAYFRNVLWNVSMLEIAVHAPVPQGSNEVVASWGWPDERQSWTWPTASGTTPLSVNVYTRHASAQLLVNDKPIQTAPISVNYSTQYTATFTVPFTVGKLTAIGYDEDGHEAERKEFLTAGEPASIVLAADRTKLDASRSDLAFVSATIVDSRGIPVPTAAIPVAFTVGGDGELAAVSSGDPTDPSSFFSSTRTTYRGVAIGIIRPGSARDGVPTSGTITIKATAPGLPGVQTSVSF